MGDFVDSGGVGRNFTPNQLDRLICGATYETAAGYTVSCSLMKGHTCPHQGVILGSKANWTSDRRHDSEYEQHLISESPND